MIAGGADFFWPAAWIALAAVTFFALLIGALLDYHWRNFEIKKERIIKLRTVYFGVCSILTLAMAFSIYQLFLL